MNEDDIKKREEQLRRKAGSALGKRSWEKRKEKYGEAEVERLRKIGKLGGRPKKSVENSEESDTVDA